MKNMSNDQESWTWHPVLLEATHFVATVGADKETIRKYTQNAGVEKRRYFYYNTEAIHPQKNTSPKSKQGWWTLRWEKLKRAS